MMTTVVCTNCNQNLDVEDAVDSVECACGETVSVSAAEPKTTACPSCDAPSPVDSLLCTECGYNFQTGSQVNTEPEPERSSDSDDYSEDDEDISFFYRYKPLIKLGVVLLIVGLAVIVYIVETGKHFGISDEAPLGTKQGVEEYLLKIGMVREDDAFNPLTMARLKGTCMTFKDRELYQRTKGMFNEYVHLVLDEKDQPVAICGVFISDDMGGPKGGRTHGFLRTLWVDLGGDPKGMTLDNRAVDGKWTTTTSIMGVLQINRETIGVALKGSKYVDVVDLFCSAGDGAEVVPAVPGL